MSLCEAAAVAPQQIAVNYALRGTLISRGCGLETTCYKVHPCTSLHATVSQAQAVEAGLIATEWFVTGAVDARLFSDNFVFRDESVSTSGLRAYALGVRRLFDQASARCELVSVDVAAPQQQQQQQQQQLTVVWRLTGRVNLLWQPEIKPYVVTTTFTLEERTGLIVEQDDAFAVPGWDLLLSALLGHWLGAPPAPPVAELRAVAKRTTSAAA
jgi:Uncharacterized conserved protein (DUF2358)